MSRRAIPAGAASLAAALLASTALAQPGSLDTTFSGDGRVMTDFTTNFDAGWAIAIQPTDGKIVVAGEAAGSGGRFALARYDTDGKLDPTFGGDGKVMTNFTTQYDAAFGVVVQSDGKIVAAGDGGLGSGNSMFAVARYLPDGRLDPSFGSGTGKVTTQFTARDDGVAGLALQSDGKILVSGGTNFGGANGKFAVARYNADGTLDLGFSADGKVSTEISAGRDYANGVAEVDGEVVAAGLATPGSRAVFALVRYNADGTLDTTFDGDGRVTTDFTSWHDSVQNIVIQPDQKIVAAGIAGLGAANPKFALARYDVDGTLDATFSEDGKVTTDFTASFDGAYDLVLEPDGQIVAAGEAGGSGGRFALARYDSDGTLDSGFGSSGKVTTNFTSRVDFATGVALQSDGKIVAAGGAAVGASNPKFSVARYNAT